MTVIKLADGSLFVRSPVRLDRIWRAPKKVIERRHQIAKVVEASNAIGSHRIG